MHSQAHAVVLIGRIQLFCHVGLPRLLTLSKHALQEVRRDNLLSRWMSLIVENKHNVTSALELSLTLLFFSNLMPMKGNI